MKAEIKFRPLERETLEIMQSVYEQEGKDPVAAYSRLLSAAMVSAAILGMTPEQVAQQAETCVQKAIEAVEGRPDIFGERT